MPLTGIALDEANRDRYIPTGVGMIRKSIFKQGVLKARRQNEFRPLTDEELNQLLKAGIRVNDKQRGIYVHI